MSIEKTEQELRDHSFNAIQQISSYIDGLITADDPDSKARGDKFCYWIEDYVKFLRFESQFKPTSLKRYKRGEIIKVHLGYNIGSEEGGLHYAVVLDKRNSIYSPVMTIVPLTSVKPTTNIKKLPMTSIYLGNELFTNLSAQIQLTKQHIRYEYVRLKTVLDNNAFVGEDIEKITNDIKKLENEQRFLTKMNREIEKMRKGSIALINQVTTISKIRIYDPKTSHDILSHVRLSDQKLDSIDSALISQYTGRK